MSRYRSSIAMASVAVTISIAAIWISSPVAAFLGGLTLGMAGIDAALRFSMGCLSDIAAALKSIELGE